MDAREENLVLTVEVVTEYPDGDVELVELARGIRADLLELDVDSVVPATATREDGTKSAGDPLTWQTLLITLSASGGVLVTVVAALRDWLNKRQDLRSVELTIGGDSLKLSGATQEQRQQLIDAFINRHGSDG